MLGRYTILASDMDDVEAARDGQFEHTDDVHTNAGKLCVGGESSSEIWVGGLEYVGNLSCDRGTPGLSVGDGDHLRVESTEEGESWAWRRGRWFQ